MRNSNNLSFGFIMFTIFLCFIVFLLGFHKDINSSPNVVYSVYYNKNKDYLIDNNYDVNCLFESGNDSCYIDFLTYYVVLKKYSDKKYHFYGIYHEKLEDFV